MEINGSNSDGLSLEISVIQYKVQGSILEPILFFCYINDYYVYTATSLFSVLFADDIQRVLAKEKNLMNSQPMSVKNLTKLQIVFEPTKWPPLILQKLNS